jgi:hypothetical protein
MPSDNTQIVQDVYLELRYMHSCSNRAGLCESPRLLYPPQWQHECELP